jgi:hypothetical protein
MGEVGCQHWVLAGRSPNAAAFTNNNLHTHLNDTAAYTRSGNLDINALATCFGLTRQPSNSVNTALAGTHGYTFKYTVLYETYSLVKASKSV